MIVYDSNVFYRATRDCRTAPNRGLCETRKRQSLELLKLGEREGCIITPTVAREVRRVWLREYAEHCRVVTSIEDKKKREFIRKFIDKLTVIADKDEKFLRTCTHEDPDKWRAILKSRNGDWKIIAESLVVDGDVKIASFDRDMTDSYCLNVYRSVARDVASKLGLKVGNLDVVKLKEVTTIRS